MEEGAGCDLIREKNCKNLVFLLEHLYVATYIENIYNISYLSGSDGQSKGG